MIYTTLMATIPSFVAIDVTHRSGLGGSGFNKVRLPITVALPSLSPPHSGIILL
jgi:hypothetical protein